LGLGGDDRFQALFRIFLQALMAFCTVDDRGYPCPSLSILGVEIPLVLVSRIVSRILSRIWWRTER